MKILVLSLLTMGQRPSRPVNRKRGIVHRQRDGGVNVTCESVGQCERVSVAVVERLCQVTRQFNVLQLIITDGHVSSPAVTQGSKVITHRQSVALEVTQRSNFITIADSSFDNELALETYNSGVFFH